MLIRNLVNDSIVAEDNFPYFIISTDLRDHSANSRIGFEIKSYFNYSLKGQRSIFY